MNVLSLFDGISCGQLALQRAGISYKNYYASEIDKYAIKIANKNFPDTIQLGDVNNWKSWKLPTIDLLIGGSPCQGFSTAGKGLNFEDSRSKLFFEYVDCLTFYSPKYFLLENVKMKKEWVDVISSYVGVEPIEIDSALVSAQNRKRLYWTNIPNITQPEDKHLFWSDTYERGSKGTFYYTQKSFDWIFRDEYRRGRYYEYLPDDKIKMQMIEASHCKSYSNQRCFGIRDICGVRYISPIECERLQTLPDNYTEGVSNNQRYKMLGNAWTVDVIAHIFKNLVN